MPTGIGGEVGWWCPSLDETGNGTTTLYDLSGNGNNGTLTNMDAGSDWVANTESGGVRALDFDGTNDHINLGDIISAPSPYLSISAWVKVTSGSTCRVVSKGIGAAGEREYCLIVFGGKAFFNIAKESISDVDSVTGATTLSTGVWYHLCGTWDGGNLRLYLNGSLDGGPVITSVTGIENRSSNLYIGRSEGTTNPYANGLIDDVRIFTRVLSPSEAAKLASKRGYQPPVGLGGEVGWWCPSLDNAGNGTSTIYDLASSNNGTLTNMDPATDWVSDTDSGGVRAVDLDGVNDLVLFGSNSDPSGTTSMTVAMWAKVSSGIASGGRMVQTRGTGSPKPGYQIRVEQSGSNVRLITSGGFTRLEDASANYVATDLSGATLATIDTWFHFAMVVDRVNNEWRFYTNGTQVGSAVDISSVTGSLETSNQLSVGAADNDQTQPFKGRFDDLRVFHRVLSPSEVSSLASTRGYQPPAGTLGPNVFGNVFSNSGSGQVFGEVFGYSAVVFNSLSISALSATTVAGSTIGSRSMNTLAAMLSGGSALSTIPLTTLYSTNVNSLTNP